MGEVPVLIYIGCKRQDNSEFYQSWPASKVQSRGGVTALEHDLGEVCKWFAQIGCVELPPQRGGRTIVPRRVLKLLTDAWRANGAPKHIGWRQRELELYRTVENAVAPEAGRLAHSHWPQTARYDGKDITPRLNEFPNILQKLDGGELVNVNVKINWNCFIKENDGSIMQGKEGKDYQLWIWRENDEASLPHNLKFMEKPFGRTRPATGSTRLQSEVP